MVLQGFPGGVFQLARSALSSNFALDCVCVLCVVCSCWTAFHSIANVVLHPHGHTDSRLLMVCCKNQCVTIEESNWVWQKRTWRDRQGGQVTKGGGVDYISNWCHMDRHTGLYGAGCCVVKTGPFPNRVFFLFLFSQCRLTFQRNISLWSSHRRIWWWWWVFFSQKES